MYRYGRRVLRTSLAIVTLVGLAMGVVGCRMTSMPGKSYRGALPDATDIEQASQARLKRDLGVIASDIGSRSQFEVPALRKTEAYLQETLEKIGYAVERQDYQSRGVEVANLVVEVPGSTHVKEIVVVGAHCDTATVMRARTTMGRVSWVCLSWLACFMGQHLRGHCDLSFL